ncbi:tRNA 2-selenouridine(34) synthase MnmH [Leisingera methylohalidivorans]|uniref:tRNA 2-selenouridine synthase n=1 Tax=Leisingera methylohalidivorans DSM 14336 TaxID=999552 RepID=V9VT68_9RHOB|nr:tRNA 2-selenouridine(34) synthase MnmH [Leisingera methylohalidivorans]AHD00525.1 tRNA 2-selenouridine synthase [Leisingera methylohalidivorans DSM 14336]
MALKFTSLQDFYAHGYDTVIDVRSPAEYAEDRVPGAISLPVLDNAERAEVGTIYVQDSPFKARKLGAALVFRNAANHIEQRLSHHEGGWRPLVYCWRGGQRSGSFTWMLQQIGWRAEVVEGGYQSYRRLVNAALYQTALPHRLVALDGYTGSAKTEVLKRAGQLGVQVLDLEGLANHRGSLLGDMPTPQPSQKGFESALAGAVMQLDPSRPVLVEAESSKVGQRIIPPSVWAGMKQAPRIELQVPAAARCGYLTAAYDDILSDADGLREKLAPLRAYRSGAVVDGWFSRIAEGDKAGLTKALMAEHYDPAYRKSRAAIGAKVAAIVEAGALDDAGLDAAAAAVARIISSL